MWTAAARRLVRVIAFVKGHGTENDFVLLPDPDGELALDAERVRRLCDRRAGIGADGVLRVVRIAADSEARGLAGADRATWFMDYRNADGSPAEMCGNGIRVFARFLVNEGLEEAGRLRIDNRDGVKDVDAAATGDVTVDMGLAVRLDDAKVALNDSWYDGAGWSMGNPHLVVLDGPGPATADLTTAPAVEPAASYPDGVNVEVVERVGPCHIRMRVHERGVGETRSCGTGACAAAVAAMAAAGERATYIVDVPGGRLMVEWRPDGSVLLTGPAALTARGETDVAIS
jgi:diaminopimelate epimerase